MWFARHPEIHEQLDKEIIQKQLPLEEVQESIFKNGTFEQLESVKKWIAKLTARQAKQSTIKNFVGRLKQICKGELPHNNKIENWSFKHPDRLTLKNALEYLVELEKVNCYKRGHRLTLRNFLKSQNVEGWDEISGKLESQAGKYAHLYTTKMPEIFAWVKDISYEAFLASFFAYKTACRTTATLNAHSKYVDREQKTIWVFEKATKGNPKRKLEKVIPDDLWDLLLPRIEKGGKLFDITKKALRDLLRACYKEVIPELAPEIPMSFHFFRHQFAQHMLRTTDWNYGLVARLGHWTVETLERYYGKMDKKTVMDSGRKFLPQI